MPRVKSEVRSDRRKSGLLEGSRLQALAALFLLGIFAPSFVLLTMLWYSLAERHQLEIEKRGLERAEAIQSLHGGVALEIELRRAQATALPPWLASPSAPFRLRDDGALLPFEAESLQTELEEDALLLANPAFFDAVREEQRGTFPLALLHYRRALKSCKADSPAARRIELAMARVQHRAGRQQEAMATLDRMDKPALTKAEAWACARIRLLVARAGTPGSALDAAMREARARLEDLRPKLGLLEYLTLADELGPGLGRDAASATSSATGTTTGTTAGTTAGTTTPSSTTSGAATPQETLLAFYRFLVANRDRWAADPDASLIWAQAPGGAAVLLLAEPDEVEPMERQIRFVPRREILDAAIERDASLTRLFHVSESPAESEPESDAEPGGAAFVVDLEPLGLRLSLVDRDPLAESLWEDPQARFLLVLASLTLLGLALGLVASLRAVAKESRLSRMRADFISSVSHELKTPLTSLRLYSDLLASPDTGSEKRLEYQSRIREETKKLTHLVGNVLDAARIEAGRKYLMEAVDLAELVREQALAWKARAQARGATIEVVGCDPSSGGSVLVMGDAEALTQVLSNLLDNAIKYGGSRITLALRQSGDHVELRVRDDGPGIPKAQRARLFAAYERGSEHGPGCAPGSGLGLAIAQDIVDAHAGARMEIEDSATGEMCMLLSFAALRQTIESPAAAEEEA